MPKKFYSIKSLDGSRFDWFPKDGQDLINELNAGSFSYSKFIGLPIEGGTKWMNINNVVSITEMEVDS